MHRDGIVIGGARTVDRRRYAACFNKIGVPSFDAMLCFAYIKTTPTAELVSSLGRWCFRISIDYPLFDDATFFRLIDALTSTLRHGVMAEW